jgi:hypothetical protein
MAGLPMRFERRHAHHCPVASGTINSLNGPRLSATVHFLFGAVLAVSCLAGLALADQAGASPSQQRGIAIYVDVGQFDEATALDHATATFDYAKSLNANSVQLSFPFEMTSWASNDPHDTASVVPMATLLNKMVTLAEGNGLSVELRPLLLESNLPPGASWRGEIQPTQPKVWFANYWTFLQPYLTLARNDGVASFYLESELDSMVTPALSQRWSHLASEAAQIHPGKLVGSTSHTAYLFRHGIAQAYDDYDPTIQPDSASVATLTKSLENSLDYDAIPGKRSKLVLSEVGIPAVRHAYWQPWKFDVTGPIKRKVQVNWFTAMCDVAHAEHLAGIYYWDLDMGSSTPGGYVSDPANWVNTKGANAITACFKKLAS